MNKKTFLFAFIFVFFFCVNSVSAQTYTDIFNISDIIEDGRIINFAGFTRDINDDVIQFGETGGQIDRGWVVWNISRLDDGIVVTNVTLRYSAWELRQIDAYVKQIMIRPDQGDANLTYWAIGNGTAINSTGNFPINAPNQKEELSTFAQTTFTSSVANGWYAIGFQTVDETNLLDRIDASDNVTSSPAPTLYITYHYPYNYTFSGVYYEDGTRDGAQTITVVNVAGNTEFLLNGSITEGYGLDPTAFVWDAGSGIARRIYTIGVNENYTITIPDDTFSVYEFTIKDYVGAIGNQQVWLESYRVINGTTTLIERSPVEDQINGVGLSLVLYKLYTIQLRYGTTTIQYQFVPGVDVTPTLQLRDFPFSDKAQAINRYCAMEATRSANGTIIYGSYRDLLNNTNLVEFIVQYINGTQIQYQNSTNSIVTFVWPSAVNTTDYRVIMRVNYSGFTGIRRFGFVLPGIRNYDAVPDLGLFGSWGGIAGTSILGIGFIVVIGSIFSEKYMVAGAFAMVVVAAILNQIGFIDLTYLELISAALAAALLSIITSRSRT